MTWRRRTVLLLMVVSVTGLWTGFFVGPPLYPPVPWGSFQERRFSEPDQ